MDNSILKQSPRIAVPALMTGLVLFLFWSAIANIAGRWLSSEEYSHGFIALAVALFYLVRRRGALQALAGRSTWLAVPVIAVGAALALFSELGATFFLSQYGLVILLAGLILGLFGTSGLRIVAPALLLTLVVVPLPYFLEAQATARLQLLSTQAGVAILHILNIAAYADGNVVDLGSFQLDVVEACSGLRYLFPLTGLAVIVAFLYRGGLWPRALVVASAPPIAIGMNILRIAIIGILVEHQGIAAAEGFIHAFEGGVIFLACALILLGEIALINLLVTRQPWGDIFGLDDSDAIPSVSLRIAWTSAPMLAGLLVLIVASPAVAALRFRTPVIPSRPPLLLFPLELAGWRGDVVPLTRPELRFLGNPDYLNVNFVRAGDGVLNLFIAYYDQQSQGVSPHSPQVCIPGSGWTITSLQQRPIMIDGRLHMVNRAIVESGPARQIVYYAFYQRGRWMTDEYQVKFALLEDGLLRNRTDGALIRLNAPILPGSTEAMTDAMLTGFLRQAMAPIGRFVPQ
ncbi:MAG: VPLPA-CTERM-specific exosortase XrtD [Sphingomonas sp.]|nr:VPLPA-CTERM-specific exosortase XrtD [Sphingomonas sp.]